MVIHVEIAMEKRVQGICTDFQDSQMLKFHMESEQGGIIENS